MAMVADQTTKIDDEIELDSGPSLFRFSVANYEKAVFEGVLVGRIELVHGRILKMAAMKGPHLRALGKLHRTLVMSLGDAAFVVQQSPVRMVKQDSELEPDFALFPPAVAQSDSEDAPDASEALLVIEISDTTLKYDRQVKLPLYAQSGVPEYWIVNLKSKTLEVYRDLEGDDYQTRQTYKKGQSVAPATFPAIPIEWW